VPRNGTSTSQPLLSVVTPSLNQGRFIADALDSVTSQGYSAVEHIIIESGSTDETRSVLQQYARSPHIRVIEDIPPRGQSAALNVGFHAARGEIIGWLNADDRYCSGAFKAAIAALGDAKHALAYGDWEDIDENGSVTALHTAGVFDLRRHLNALPSIMQPASFYRRELFDRIGYLDEALHYGMDFDLVLRAARATSFRYIPQPLAQIRRHPASKSATQASEFDSEFRRIARRHGGPLISMSLRRRVLRLMLGERLSAHLAWHIGARSDRAAGRGGSKTDVMPKCPLCRRGIFGGRP